MKKIQFKIISETFFKIIKRENKTRIEKKKKLKEQKRKKKKGKENEKRKQKQKQKKKRTSKTKTETEKKMGRPSSAALQATHRGSLANER